MLGLPKNKNQIATDVFDEKPYIIVAGIIGNACIAYTGYRVVRGVVKLVRR